MQPLGKSEQALIYQDKEFRLMRKRVRAELPKKGRNWFARAVLSTPLIVGRIAEIGRHRSEECNNDSLRVSEALRLLSRKAREGVARHAGFDVHWRFFSWQWMACMKYVFKACECLPDINIVIDYVTQGQWFPDRRVRDAAFEALSRIDELENDQPVRVELNIGGLHRNDIWIKHVSAFIGNNSRKIREVVGVFDSWEQVCDFSKRIKADNEKSSVRIGARMAVEGVEGLKALENREVSNVSVRGLVIHGTSDRKEIERRVLLEDSASKILAEKIALFPQLRHLEGKCTVGRNQNLHVPKQIEELKLFQILGGLVFEPKSRCRKIILDLLSHECGRLSIPDSVECLRIKKCCASLVFSPNSRLEILEIEMLGGGLALNVPVGVRELVVGKFLGCTFNFHKQSVCSKLHLKHLRAESEYVLPTFKVPAQVEELIFSDVHTGVISFEEESCCKRVIVDDVAPVAEWMNIPIPESVEEIVINGKVLGLLDFHVAPGHSARLSITKNAIGGGITRNNRIVPSKVMIPEKGVEEVVYEKGGPGVNIYYAERIKRLVIRDKSGIVFECEGEALEELKEKQKATVCGVKLSKHNLNRDDAVMVKTRWLWVLR